MGRGSTGARPYRRNRAAVLAVDDLCRICGHPGAKTANHIIPPGKWPRGPDGKLLPGVDGPNNLEPAHGSMGPSQPVNRCPTCGRACNQSLHDDMIVSRPQSRAW